MCVVYGLYSTRDGVIRYIGQTSVSLSRRYTVHLATARRKASGGLVVEWIRGEWLAGCGIGIKSLKEKAEWNTDEIRFIADYLARGEPLLNRLRGGSSRNLAATKRAIGKASRDRAWRPTWNVRTQGSLS